MEKKDEKVKLRIPTKAGYVEIEIVRKDVEYMINLINQNTNLTRKKESKAHSVKSLILDLIEEGFFDEPRRLKEIKTRLELKGFRFDVTSISPILHRDFIQTGIIEKRGSRGTYRYIIAKKISEQSEQAILI